MTENHHFNSFINCCILHGRVFVMSLSITNQQNNIVQSKESDRFLVSQFGQSVHVHSKLHLIKIKLRLFVGCICQIVRFFTVGAPFIRIITVFLKKGLAL